MKKGDIVRFAKWEELEDRYRNHWSRQPKRNLGILIEHDKLMGVAHVLCEGKVYQIRHAFVEKAGKNG